jgi:glycosyltransferase involved in cell wall biosynthesis
MEQLPSVAFIHEMPNVITMHGCHETILQDPGIDLSFPDRMERMIARASWVYIADKNLSVFDKLGQPQHLAKIPNGVAEAPASTPLDKATLGVRPDAVVLCLTSRAIRSKGWAEAMRLTERLNRDGHAVDLILLGEGPDFDALKAARPDNVHCLGQVPNPQAYFELADIGLLPSYFVGESLPLVLLEMMAKSLPLVASDIGEIPWIIGTGEDAAGLIVPRTDTGIDEDALHAATLKLLDPQLRHDMSVRARARYERDFTVQAMVDRYSRCYAPTSPKEL